MTTDCFYFRRVEDFVLLWKLERLETKSLNLAGRLHLPLLPRKRLFNAQTPLSARDDSNLPRPERTIRHQRSRALFSHKVWILVD